MSTTAKKNVLIIAPHIDDEMIGCWSVLRRQDAKVSVLYLYELTEERKKEASDAATHLGFVPLFATNYTLTSSLSLFDEVYVPSRRDWHADHQLVNREYRKYATHFYSVDMAHGKLLPDAEIKRDHLNSFYPSQKKLWESNDKYWLFEDIQLMDYDNYAKIVSGEIIITVKAEYADWVRGTWLPSIFNGIRFAIETKDIDTLLAYCSGKVTVETQHFKVEA